MFRFPLKNNFIFFVFLIVLTGIFSVPSKAMERSYSAPIDINPAFTILTLPVATAIVRSLTQWFPEPAEDLTTRVPTNRGVFLVTNEVGNEETIAAAGSLPRRGNVGIGVSAFFNLELFLARAQNGVTHWVMIDPAPEVQAFWEAFLEVLREAEDIDSTFERLARTLGRNSHRFFTPGFLELNRIVEQESFKQWLTTQLNFAKARLLAAMGAISFAEFKELISKGLMLFPTDLARPEAVQHLISFLQVHHLYLDTLYASNVFMHLPLDATTDFRSQIDLLRRATGGGTLAYLIEALPRREGELARITGTPIQKIYHE